MYYYPIIIEKFSCFNYFVVPLHAFMRQNNCSSRALHGRKDLNIALLNSK